METKPGRGTCFSIYLPLVSAAIDQQSQIKTQLPVGHGERILIVDDESYFREVVGEGLNLLGYEVTVQSSSLQSLDILKNNPFDFDLLLTDQAMPDMPGPLVDATGSCHQGIFAYYFLYWLQRYCNRRKCFKFRYQ